jgi:two-component system cell cycle response regulator DivK
MSELQNPGAAQGGTILYVEDTETNVSLMRLIVKRGLRGVTLLHAPTAELGIPLAIKEHPDLILMDIDLPGMNGIAALQVLRQNKETCDIPVIAISAAVMSQDMENIKAASFDAFICKPFNIQEIPATIANYMRGTHANITH